MQRQEGEFLSRLRGLYRLVPGYRRDAATRRQPSWSVGASAMADLPAKWRSKAVYVPENGIDPARFPASGATFGGELYATVRCVPPSWGGMVPYKGLRHAAGGCSAAATRPAGMVLDIIGFGPERERLDGMVADLRPWRNP